jgi:hypothetical protein
MNAHVKPDDLRKAVVDSLSNPSEDIARHVLAMAGANPNQIEKSITTGTGLVAYDLQAPAKNLNTSEMGRLADQLAAGQKLMDARFEALRELSARELGELKQGVRGLRQALEAPAAAPRRRRSAGQG